MKCLMLMYAEEDKGVIFYETVITLKWQKHTYIECVPLPWEQYEDIPQYFRVCHIQIKSIHKIDIRCSRNLFWHPRQSGLSTRS